MKIAILGDTHWGCRNDLPLFYKNFEKFYDEFFTYLIDNGIDTVFQLGDLFDRRKYINFRTLNEARRIFFDRLSRNNITLHVLVGNHDIHMRESVDINSPALLLNDYSNIFVYSNPETVVVDNTSIDIIPWICRDNEKQVLEYINSSKSDLCFGHFEIENFAMYRGMECHDGLPADMFAKYELVCSGHYHTKSSKNNINYVGTPYEMTWQDYNDPKGFHVFDTETRDLTFVQNKNSSFVRLEYDEADLVDLKTTDLTDTFVKVVVVNKLDLYRFDTFMSRVYNSGAYEVKVIEDLADYADGEVGEEINLEDTLDVLSHYIDSIETEANKDKIKTFMKSLYLEAINLEVE